MWPLPLASGRLPFSSTHVSPLRMAGHGTGLRMETTWAGASGWGRGTPLPRPDTAGLGKPEK